MHSFRKKPAVRLFRGLVGLPEETSKPEPDPAPPAVTQSVAEIQAEIIAEYDNKIKRKRGRPPADGKAMTTAERKQRSRSRQAEQSAKKAVNQAYLEKIAGGSHEHRDSAGRLHGETSGGDAVAATLDGLEVENGQVEDGGYRISAGGTDPHIFESGGYRGVRETLSHWANRQNFYTPAKWSAKEKEVYIEELAARCCVEEYYCKFGDCVSLDEEDISYHFRTEHGKDTHLKSLESEIILPDDHIVVKFRCLLGDFISEKHEDMKNHFLRDHRGYIRSMIRYHEPRIIKTARTFSTRDLNFVTPAGDDNETT